jgi:hypothetical protein
MCIFTALSRGERVASSLLSPQPQWGERRRVLGTCALLQRPAAGNQHQPAAGSTSQYSGEQSAPLSSQRERGVLLLLLLASSSSRN